MSDKNVCPHCGGEDIVAVWIYDAKHGEIRLKDAHAALCHRCKTIGPYAANETAAIAAFCHPAHLMESLHTYDPQTQIVVSREAGKQIKTCVGYYLYDENGHCDSDSRCVDAYRELCAAMEVGNEL